jgi:hypothetical protein
LGFRLGQEAHRVRYESNAGGTSTISEVWDFNPTY